MVNKSSFLKSTVLTTEAKKRVVDYFLLLMEIDSDLRKEATKKKDKGGIK